MAISSAFKATLVLGDRQYGLLPMPAIKCAAFSASVAKLLSDALGDLGALATGSVDSAKAIKALTAAIASVDTDKYMELAERALKYVACDDGNLSNTAVSEGWFSAHPGDFHKLAAWAMWELASPFLLDDVADWKAVLGGRLAQ